MSDDRLANKFVELADTLIEDFDILDFLQLLVDRCVELLEVDAAGLLLAEPRSGLQVVATSSEQVRLLELFQVQSGQGPCLDAFATGAQVSCADLSTASSRWPRFTAAADLVGFDAVEAVPMRLRSDVLGR